MKHNQIRGFLENYKKDITREASLLRGRAMPVLTKELFDIFEKTGNRLIYEGVYFERRRFLSVFGVVAIMEKRPEDISMLEEIIKDICTEKYWMLPAHTGGDIYGDLTRYIDLFAAETAQTLSAISAYLEAELSKDVKNLIRQEVERRVLLPFMSAKPPYSNWEYLKNNWNSVCNGCVGSAAMYVWRKDPEKLNPLIERIEHSIQYYLEGFEEDGACTEGLDYFTYGMNYYTWFARQLLEFSKEKKDLMAQPKLEKIAAFQGACYFKGGLSVSFSDGNIHSSYRMGLSCFLERTYEGALLPDISKAAIYGTDHCHRFVPLFQDVFWTEEYLKKSIEETGMQNRYATILPDSQWCMYESKNGCGMAAKGGHNGESHNHNDLGNFLYVVQDEMLLPDLGCGEYTKGYFGAQRYETLCCSSQGHNVPIIDGEFQKDGNHFFTDSFEADKNGRVEIEFTSAYENIGSGRIKRTLEFNQETGSLSVEDNFHGFESEQTLEENLISFTEPIVTDAGIRIQGRKQACMISGDSFHEVQILPREHQKHDGTCIMVYLLRFRVLQQGNLAKCRFMITPQ